MTLRAAIQAVLAAMPQLVQELNDLVQEIKAKVEDFGAAKDVLLGARVSPLDHQGKDDPCRGKSSEVVRRSRRAY